MLTVDGETKSYADLPKVGAWAYSEDPTTDAICLTWTEDGKEWDAWWPDHACPEYGLPECETVPTETGHTMPKDLYMACALGEFIEAHNLPFEFSIWANVLVKKYGWILPHRHQLRDSMAVARYYAMPASLDKLARALGFPAKDPEGSRLISKYSKLFLKTAKTEIPPEDFDKWLNYCGWDSCLEHAVSDVLGDLPEEEERFWQLDFDINMRGLHLDLEGIEAATEIVETKKEALTIEFNRLTGLNPGQHQKLMKWFADHGLDLENLQAEYLEGLIEEGDLPSGPARRAMEIRLAINKASTTKLDAMVRQSGQDGRARFQSSYHGALTGRDTGTGFQPLNLVRSWEKVDPVQLVRDIMYRNEQFLSGLYGDSMEAVSKALRHFITAEKGKKIIAGDFVSIEAVGLACVAGEDWKIKAFHDGVKIYEMMGEKIHKLKPGTVTKKTHPNERQDGKTGELAFGYQGALGAWLKFDKSGRHSDERIIEICKAWRGDHPETVHMWYSMEDAAMEAVRLPGTVTGFRDIGFEIVDDWLTMILPDGKRIWYREPELRAGMPQWHKPETEEDCAAGTCDCQPRLYLTYMSYKGGRWSRVSTYGGKLTENCIQATSRQILKPAIERLEKYGYTTILKVYDEVVAEVPANFGSVAEFREIMVDAAPDAFYRDWPISVDVWEGDRYKK